MIPSEGSYIETKFLKNSAPLLSSQNSPRKETGARHDQLHKVLLMIQRKEIEEKNLQHDASDPENSKSLLPRDHTNFIPSRYPTVRPCDSVDYSKLTPSEAAGRFTVTDHQDYSDMPTCSPSIEEYQSSFPTLTSVSYSSHLHHTDGKFSFPSITK